MNNRKGSFVSIAILIVITLLLGSVVFLTSDFETDSISGAAIFDQSNGGMSLWVLGLLVLIFVVILLMVYFKFAGTVNKLRKKLKKLNLLLEQGSSEGLRKTYVEAYDLYLKLSEKHKQNFYGRITKVRESVEESLRAENRIIHLFEQSEKGGLKEQKKIYEEIHHNFQKLPSQTKDKYYQRMVRLRDRLERGM